MLVKFNDSDESGKLGDSKGHLCTLQGVLEHSSLKSFARDFFAIITFCINFNLCRYSRSFGSPSTLVVLSFSKLLHGAL